MKPCDKCRKVYPEHLVKQRHFRDFGGDTESKSSLLFCDSCYDKTLEIIAKDI